MELIWKNLLNHITKKNHPVLIVLIHSSCRIITKIAFWIIDIADLWAGQLLQQRLIITCYTVHIKRLKKHSTSQVWFGSLSPTPLICSMFIFSYNATKGNHTTESDIPRNQVCTFYLRTATALNSAWQITALSPNPRTFDKLALPYKC